MNNYRHRRVSIDQDLKVNMMVLGIGIIVFIAGCTAAVIRDRENDRETELERSSQTAILTLMSEYGGISGALSLETLKERPSDLSELAPYKGKVALVTISIPGTEDIRIKIPDIETFDDHPRTLSDMQSEKVPIHIGSGRVLPCELEVILYGS